MDTEPQESRSTKLYRRALILRSAFLQFQSAKGVLEMEIDKVQELDNSLRTDSVERMLGLFREMDCVEPTVLTAIRKLTNG